MIIDRTHRSWAVASLLILLAASALYLLYIYVTPTGAQGGTLVGLGFGIVSALLMLFAGLLAVRRRIYYFSLGSRQFWLRGHIWLGLLSVPMALFHSGFGLGGALEIGLWLLTTTVILSGVLGLIMQHIVPRFLTLRVPEETFNEQSEHRLDVLRVESDKAVSEAVGPLPLHDADLLAQFVDVDALLHPADPNAKAKPVKAGPKKPDIEVRLPLTRVEEYLSAFKDGRPSTATTSSAAVPAPALTQKQKREAKLPPPPPKYWPSDLGPIERRLGVRGRRQVVRALAEIAEQLNAVVQVGLECGKVIKSNIWSRLPGFVESMYAVPSTEEPAAEAAPSAAEAEVKPKPAAIPAAVVKDPAAAAAIALAAKGAAGQGTGRIDLPADAAPAAKPLSKLEQIRQQQALAKAKKEGGVAEPAPALVASTGPAEAPAGKPLSKLEQIRQQQAAAKAKKDAAAGGVEEPTPAPAATAEAAETPPAKPLSKIEQIRQQQALAKAQKEAAAGGGTAEAVAKASPAPVAPVEEAPAKPLSKIEQIRQQQALAKAKKEAEAGGAPTPAPTQDVSPAPVAPVAEEAPAKPLSKIEQIRQQQALAKAKKEAEAGGASAAAPTQAATPAPVTPAAEEAPAKPLSKIEQIRQQQALTKAKKEAEAGAVASAAAAETTPLSAADAPSAALLAKIEKIRQEELAKPSRGVYRDASDAGFSVSESGPFSKDSLSEATPVPDPPPPTPASAPAPAGKPLSKIEQIRQQQLAKSKSKTDPPPDAGESP